MKKTELSGEFFGAFLERRNWSKAEACKRLEVSLGTIDNWLDGSKTKCSGPSALLVKLIDLWPNVLDELENGPKALPRHGTPEGSPEWLRMQRLLLLCGNVGRPQYWATLYAEEGLTKEWVTDVMYEDLLEYGGADYKTPIITELTKRLYHWDLWFAWCQRNKYSTISQTPVMTSAELKEERSRKAEWLEQRNQRRS